MAPDAVVRLVERADEVRAGVGELEAFAIALVPPGDPERVRAIVLRLHDVRQQIVRIDFSGLLEEHPCAIALAACIGEERPRGIAEREIEVLGVIGLVAHPVGHRVREFQFVECAAQPLREGGFQRCAVEGRSFGRLVLRHRLALHELAFDGINRREHVVPLGQREHRVRDPKELRQEPLEMRADREDQRRFAFRVERGGIGARREQSLVQRGIRSGQEFEKAGVESEEAVAAVKIRELEPECERESRAASVGGRAHRSR